MYHLWQLTQPRFPSLNSYFRLLLRFTARFIQMLTVLWTWRRVTITLSSSICFRPFHASGQRSRLLFPFFNTLCPPPTTGSVQNKDFVIE